MGLVRQVVETLGIPILEQAGLRGRRHHRHARHPGHATRGDDVIIVTGDRDSYQLVEDPHVKVLYNRRGVSDYALYDEAGIEERTGVTPAHVRRSTPRCAATRPTTCPACPGVGEKTAAKLINTYGGLDGIFEHLDEQTPKLRAEPGRARGAGAQQRRGDGAACATSPLDVGLDDLAAGAVRRRRGAPAVRLPRVPHAVRPAGRGARRPTSAPCRRRRPRCSRPRSTRADDAGRRRGGARRRSAADAGALAVAGVVVGRRGPLAARRAGAGRPTARRAEVAWIPAAAARRAGRRRRARRRSLAAAAAARGPRRQAAHAGAARRSASTLPHARRSTRRSPPTCSTRPRPATCSTSCCRRYADLELPTGDVGARGPARPRRRRGRRRRCSSRPPGARPSTGWSTPLNAALDAQGMRAPERRDRGPAGPGAGPHGGRRRRRRRRRAARRSTTGSATSATAADQADLGGRRRGVQRQLHAAAARGPVRRARAWRRRRRPRPASPPTPRRWRSCAASTRSSSTSSRYREVEKLRSTYGEGLLAEVGRRRPHPRHVQPDRRPHRPAVVRPPNLHNIPVRTEEGRRVPPGVRARRRAASCWSPTTTRSSCAASPTWPRTPASSPRSRPAQDIHTATASRVFGVAPDEVTLEQRSKAKMVSYGLAYGMEAYGLGQRLNIPTRGGGRDPRRLLRGVPDREGVHGPHGRPRPASGATPRRCSAGAARSPSCRRRTSASARPASARP